MVFVVYRAATPPISIPCVLFVRTSMASGVAQFVGAVATASEHFARLVVDKDTTCVGAPWVRGGDSGVSKPVCRCVLRIEACETNA